MYLLHGLFGAFDNWSNLTRIAEYASETSFAIVCVDGDDGWYADSPQLPQHNYESYIFEELIPAVEAECNLGGAKNRRAIAGLSMGGYGAFKFAFRHPERFCFAGSMSGAFHAAEIFAGDVWTELAPAIMNVFGENKLLRRHNDLFATVRDFPPEQIKKLPFFYFDCGTEDAFLPVNSALRDLFKARGIRHLYQEIPGGHDWHYWDSRLPVILKLAGRCFNLPDDKLFLR